MAKGEPVRVKKGYSAGSVGVSMRVNCWNNGSSVRVEASTVLTTAQARALSQSLIEAADKEDVMVFAKAAAEERRKKWRDREVAAGRMKIFSAGEFLR